MTSTPDPRATRIVDALVDAHLVEPSAREASVAVVAAALDGRSDAPTTGRRALPQLVEVVAYLGGALVLAAGALFLVEQWDGLHFPVRVALLTVVTVVLGVAGFAAARVPEGEPGISDTANDVRRRLAGSLLTFAALGAACLVGLVVDHALTLRNAQVDWQTVCGGLVGVVLGAIGYRIAPTALGLLATIGAAIAVTMSLVDGVDRYEGDAAGLALFVLGALWLALTELHWFGESTVARSLGVTTALVGAQVPVLDGTNSWLGYVLTAVVAAAGVSLYLRRTAWPYLAVAVIAVTLVVPEAISDWTGGSLGAVGGVLVAGVTLLAASYAGYRLRAEATD